MPDEMRFTDRYQALGIPYPDPATICPGQCEGTGVYPVYHGSAGALRPNNMGAKTSEELQRWTLLHARGHGVWGFFRILWDLRRELSPSAVKFAFGLARRCDGWHFITCPTCDGTGKRSNP